ncbi:MAG: zf-HC2 domain-containing protein [Phycisphaerae bacterium]|nr:zf-HC2 domain-containing protein [Phycisphaerae bacterium]
MHSCYEYRERLDAWLDGELPPVESADLAAHLDACGACRRFFDDAARLNANLARLAVAADRIAAAPRRVHAGRYAAWRIGRIAAGLLLAASVGLALWSARTRPPIETPAGRPDRVAIVRPAEPSPGDLLIDSACRVETIVRDCTPALAVCMPSQNASIRIVWLYGPVSPPTESEPSTSPGPASRV